MLTAVCLVVVAQTPQFDADRFDVGERLRRLDVAWQASTAPEARAATLPFLAEATSALLTQQFSIACRGLDGAVAALEGRELRPEDAVTVRADPPYAQPGAAARFRLDCAYEPSSLAPLQIASSGVEVELRPGNTAFIEVDPRIAHPQLAQELELGVLVPIHIGARTAQAFVSITKNFAGRATALARSNDPAVRQIGQLIRKHLEGRGEFDVPLIDYLFAAEALESGAAQIDELRSVPIATVGETALRAAFPDEMSEPTTVVIALHGVGGSESSFMESYGRGLAMTEALGRGWAFISPTASRSAVDDSLKWLAQTRGLVPERTIVLGHGLGGSMALASADHRVTAIGLFAPVGGTPSDAAPDAPIFLAVGEGDMDSALATAERIDAQAHGRANFEFATYERCGHLMIVAEAVEDAYRFFETTLRDR